VSTAICPLTDSNGMIPLFWSSSHRQEDPFMFWKVWDRAFWISPFYTDTDSTHIVRASIEFTLVRVNAETPLPIDLPHSVPTTSWWYHEGVRLQRNHSSLHPSPASEDVWWFPDWITVAIFCLRGHLRAPWSWLDIRMSFHVIRQPSSANQLCNILRIRCTNWW
jgi:hypothetical protein